MQIPTPIAMSPPAKFGTNSEQYQQLSFTKAKMPRQLSLLPQAAIPRLHCCHGDKNSHFSLQTVTVHAYFDIPQLRCTKIPIVQLSNLAHSDTVTTGFKCTGHVSIKYLRPRSVAGTADKYGTTSKLTDNPGEGKPRLIDKSD